MKSPKVDNSAMAEATREATRENSRNAELNRQLLKDLSEKQFAWQAEDDKYNRAEAKKKQDIYAPVANQYGDMFQLYKDYIQGADFNKQVDYNNLQNTDAYKFRLQQGQDALNANAAAGGGLMSGAQQKALLEYGQNFASNEYNNEYNRLQNEKNNQLTGLGNLFNMASQGAGGFAGINTNTNLGAINSQIAGNYANQLMGINNQESETNMNSIMSLAQLKQAEKMGGGGGMGALGGAASGALTGAAAGSVIPGIGTVAGGIMGGLAGLFSARG